MKTFNQLKKEVIKTPKAKAIYKKELARLKKKPVDVLSGYCECIPWEQCAMNMKKIQYRQFVKWMGGQTCPIGGVWPCDLRRFLLGLDCID